MSETTYTPLNQVRSEKRDLAFIVGNLILKFADTLTIDQLGGVELKQKYHIMEEEISLLEALMWSRLEYDIKYKIERKKVDEAVYIDSASGYSILKLFARLKLLAKRLHYFGMIERTSYVDYSQGNDQEAIRLVDRVIKLAEKSPPHFNLFLEKLKESLAEVKEEQEYATDDSTEKLITTTDDED